MPVCETCGNNYDKAFQILVWGQSHTFDSFECAIQALAPDMRALRMSRHRTWCGSEFDRILLRPLRGSVWFERDPRSRVECRMAGYRKVASGSTRTDVLFSLEVQQ